MSSKAEREATITRSHADVGVAMVYTALRPMVTPDVSARSCPRCGRPVERGPRARWCSDSCKVLAWQERRGKSSGRTGGSSSTTPAAELQDNRKLTVLLPLWEAVLADAFPVWSQRHSGTADAIRDARRALQVLARVLESSTV